MNLYPLFFKPIYKEKIWGGNKLRTHFNRNIPSEKTGESWEIAAHENGTSTVVNGPYKGQTINNLINKFPKKMLGTTRLNNNKFPLLIKFIDASRKLSVQVHPDNKYAQLIKGVAGKTEMWYVISAEPKAKLIHGFKNDTSRKEIKRAVIQGNLEDYLNRVPVKTGDIFFMPAGTVHGIEEGILLAEIQQNSDTTYRLYDWNRTDKNGKKRDLHIEKALKVCNFKENKNSKIIPLTYQSKNFNRHYLAACPYFVTEKIDIKTKYDFDTAHCKFYVIIILEGYGQLYYGDKKYEYIPGQTIYLPASLGRVSLAGKSNILLSYLPETKANFINNLLNQGFKENEINKLAGINNWYNMV